MPPIRTQKKKKRNKKVKTVDEVEPEGLLDEIYGVPVFPMSVCNIVCNCSVRLPIHLISTCLILRGKLDPEVFPVVVCTSRSPRATNSLFESGEMVITGATSIEAALVSAHRVAQKLRQDTKQHYMIDNFRVVNIVCVVNMGFELNLDLIYCDHQATSEQPEDFVGLNLEMFNPYMKFVCFTSGKLVVAGLKYAWQQAIVQKRLPMFLKYRLGAEYRVLEPGRGRIITPKDQRKKKNGGLLRKKKRATPITVSEYTAAIALEGCEDF